MENLYHRIDHISFVIPLIESQKEAIITGWMEDENVIRILKSKRIKLELFAQRFPPAIIDYFIGVLKHENRIGDCPEILKMIMFFKSVNITVADVFTICMGLRKSLFKETLESEAFLKSVDMTRMIESFETVHAVFDANLAGVLNNYTKTINQFNTELKRQIKENKEKDEIMALQARQAAMGEIITMLAHQWRQPLASINMMINNVLLDFEMDTVDLDHVKENLDEASHNIIMLSETIDQFRKFFNKSAKVEEVTARSLIGDLEHLIAHVLKEHGIDLRIKIDNKELSLETSRQELVQALLNVLNNAKEALLGREVAVPWVELSVEEAESGIRFVVCDNAGGIDENVMPHIFEPYYSTKKEQNGMGVGLYIVRLIMKKHLGGSIDVKNRDKGACFTLTVPKKKEDQG